MGSRRHTGVILILLGIFFLAKQLHWISGDIPILAIIGFGFFVMYFTRGGKNNYHNIGVLIPGALLLCIGTASWIEPIFYIDGSTALGVGFLLIYLLHTIHFSSGSIGRQHWPLIPAIVFLGQGTTGILDRIDFSNLWPLLLILIGGSMIMQHKKTRKNQGKNEKKEYIDYRNQSPRTNDNNPQPHRVNDQDRSNG